MVRSTRNLFYRYGAAGLLAVGLYVSHVAAFGTEDLTFTLTSGGADLASDVRAASLVRQAIEDGRTAPDELVAAARAEYRQLLGILYDEGYFNPVISVRVDGREAADLSPLRVPGTVGRIEIIVAPGNPFRFGTTEIGPLAPGTTLPDGFRPGAAARVPVIESAARSAVGQWRDLGHAKATILREEIIADHAAERILVDVDLAPGPRLRFGSLNVSGNQRVRTDRILAIAGLPSGAVYRPEEVEKATRRLRRTGAFRAVALRDAETVGPGDQLDIEATLVEQKRRRLGAGVELSSQEGLRLSSFWMHRNLFGGAERLRFDAQIEDIGAEDNANGIDYLLGASFRRPAHWGPDRDLYLLSQLEREEEPGYLSDRFDIGGGIAWIVSDTLEVTAGVLFTAARTDDAFGARDYRRFGLPIQATWDTRDAPLDATEGAYLRAEVTPFFGLDGIDSGALVELDGRAYRSLGDRLVLAGRVQTGNLFGPEIAQAPPEDLFYAGGGGSVRGQPYQELGAGEVNGTLFGGRSYLAVSAETRLSVAGPFGLVGFYDAGYVAASESFDGSGEWVSGAGLGLRYDTGFGPIRLDLATPVNGGASDNPDVQVYIGIGQAF